MNMRQPPGRRLARLFHLVTIVGLLSPAAIPGVARADEKADAIFKQAREATQALTALKAELELTGAGRPATPGSLLLKRPNMARIELKGLALVVADGKTLTFYQPELNRYQRANQDPNQREV